MNIDKAYELVKTAMPKASIQEGIIFRNKFLFYLGGTCFVEVKDNKVVTADMDEIFNNADEFGAAREKAVHYH